MHSRRLTYASLMLVVTGVLMLPSVMVPRHTVAQEGGPSFIQICKETVGGLTGTFQFTSPAFPGIQTISIVGGISQPACAPLTPVSAGTIDITEQPAPGTELVQVRTLGPGACTLSDRMVTCELEAGGPTQATFIIFRNAAVPTSKEQCKNKGYQAFIDPSTGEAFKNQGQCIQFVNTGK